LPHLVPKVSNLDRLPREKALIFLKDHFPDKLAHGFHVRAILMPRITGLPETRLAKSSPAAGLRALAPSTIFQLPGARDDDFQNLIGLVKQVPSHVLELGTDLRRIPDVISDLLSEG
ncbi:MAG: serine kinase, partial [Candidatus Zixiibacteriota bacterium]